MLRLGLADLPVELNVTFKFFSLNGYSKHTGCNCLYAPRKFPGDLRLLVYFILFQLTLTKGSAINTLQHCFSLVPVTVTFDQFEKNVLIEVSF